MPKLIVLAVVLLSILGCSSKASRLEARAQLEADSRASLQTLYSISPTAKALGSSAAGILVFPRKTEGGFLVGGRFGDGVLFQNNQNTGTFRAVSGSFGFQAGLHNFGSALFFMSESDLEHLSRTAGLELGVGPTLTVMDTGVTASLSSNTLREGIIAFVFEQRGLMGGVRLQGTRIARRPEVR